MFGCRSRFTSSSKIKKYGQTSKVCYKVLYLKGQKQAQSLQ